MLDKWYQSVIIMPILIIALQNHIYFKILSFKDFKIDSFSSLHDDVHSSIHCFRICFYQITLHDILSQKYIDKWWIRRSFVVEFGDDAVELFKCETFVRGGFEGDVGWV